MSRPPLTDSPWFWGMLFSCAALVALTLVTPKYAPRQRKLEMQYYAREEIVRRQAEGVAEARQPGLEGEAPPPTTDELIIPLWPLFGVAAAGLVVSSYFLWQSRLRSSNPEVPS